MQIIRIRKIIYYILLLVLFIGIFILFFTLLNVVTPGILSIIIASYIVISMGILNCYYTIFVKNKLKEISKQILEEKLNNKEK